MLQMNGDVKAINDMTLEELLQHVSSLAKIHGIAKDLLNARLGMTYEDHDWQFDIGQGLMAGGVTVRGCIADEEVALCVHSGGVIVQNNGERSPTIPLNVLRATLKFFDERVAHARELAATRRK